MNKKLIIPIVASIATIGVVAGVTYAFFSANVVENNKTETVIKTNELNITYTGGTEITASNMIPGDSFTKTFSVENTSNTPVDYNIYMESITNEFNEDLVYTLTDDNGEVINETELPDTSDKEYIKKAIKINASETKNYTLKVEYKYLDTPQNDYLGKSFNATLGIDTDKVELSFTGLCRRAEVLHTEECVSKDSSNPSYYCSGDGYTLNNRGTTISYGNIGTNGILASGDAFDCDVNGDGIYNSENERFYYVSDYYNTITKAFENDKAVLIYYNNTISGIADNSKEIAYYATANQNWHGPVTAVDNLPTKTQWNNVSLINSNRQILTENNLENTIDKQLALFNYGNHSTRLITAQEMNVACNITIGNSSVSELSKCMYLFENTQYSNMSNGTYGLWLETVRSNSSTAGLVTFAMNKFVGNSSVNYANKHGVRPVIEINKTEIEI